MHTFTSESSTGVKTLEAALRGEGRLALIIAASLHLYEAISPELEQLV